jgi:hypothetical protein
MAQNAGGGLLGGLLLGVGEGYLGRKEEQHARKQGMKAQEFQDKHDEIQGQIANLQTKLASVPEESRNTPDYLKLQDQLAQATQSRNEHWKSLDHPNAIMKFGKMLGRDLKFGNKKDDTTVAPPVYGQPTMDIDGEKVPTGPAYKVQGPQTPEQVKAQTEAGKMISALPLSPERQALQGVQTDASTKLASFNASVKNFQAMNPDATPEEIQSFRNDQIQKMYVMTTAGNWANVKGKMNGQDVTLLFDKKTHQYRLQNGEAVPQDMLATFVPETNTTESTRTRADFAEYQKQHPEYKGTFEQWKNEQAGIGRNTAAASKPESFDKQYQAVLLKEASGQPLTPDEIARKAAWQIWNKETKIDPGVARMAAAGANRYIMVYNPADPENVIPMRAGDAAKAGFRSPQSIAFQTDKAITRYMVAGQGAVNINYFNTATDHLEILRQAGEALNNGDYPLFNKYANSFATATGAPAPTNFDAVKSAVAGELSKTFKGTGATDQEIAEINQTINNAQSPQQIQGAIEYYTKLMGSKLNALKGQYDAGKSGRPNFPGASTTPQSGGAGAKHKIKIGNKFYTYNGTGDTSDIKSYTEVPK